MLTSLARAGQKLERYEIGDLARLITDPCPCGRLTPRFELLGRHGDVFRIASMFFNYAKFANILSDVFQFDGEMQIVLKSGDKTEKEELCILLSSTRIKDAQNVRTAFLDNYADLRECVVDDALLELKISVVAPNQLQKTAGSGKLKRVVDERDFSKSSRPARSK